MVEEAVCPSAHPFCPSSLTRRWSAAVAVKHEPSSRLNVAQLPDRFIAVTDEDVAHPAWAYLILGIDMVIPLWLHHSASLVTREVHPFGVRVPGAGWFRAFKLPILFPSRPRRFDL
jgi:hypothetical protein